jgi:serine/threonine protein kinase
MLPYKLAPNQSRVLRKLWQSAAFFPYILANKRGAHFMGALNFRFLRFFFILIHVMLIPLISIVLVTPAYADESTFIESNLTGETTKGSRSSHNCSSHNCSSEGLGMFHTTSFDFQGNLGEGAQGMVRKATCHRWPQEVAVKTGGKELKKEIRAYRALRETQAVPNFHGGGATKNKVTIVMELSPEGSLLDYFNECAAPFNPLSPVGQHLFREAVKNLLIIHEKSWLHRDIKPANIFLFKDENNDPLIKFGDLGMALPLGEAQADKELRGSAAFMAPEIFSDCVYDNASDWWALGASFWQIFSGVLPQESEFIFDQQASSLVKGKDKRELNQFFYRAFYEGTVAGLNGHVPEIARDASMLNPRFDYETRQSALIALDLLRRMMALDPQDRLQGEAIWEHPYWNLELPDEGFANPFFPSRH